MQAAHQDLGCPTCSPAAAPSDGFAEGQLRVAFRQGRGRLLGSGSRLQLWAEVDGPEVVSSRGHWNVLGLSLAKSRPLWIQSHRACQPGGVLARSSY